MDKRGWGKGGGRRALAPVESAFIYVRHMVKRGEVRQNAAV